MSADSLKNLFKKKSIERPQMNFTCFETDMLLSFNPGRVEGQIVEIIEEWRFGEMPA